MKLNEQVRVTIVRGIAESLIGCVVEKYLLFRLWYVIDTLCMLNHTIYSVENAHVGPDFMSCKRCSLAKSLPPRALFIYLFNYLFNFAILDIQMQRKTHTHTKQQTIQHNGHELHTQGQSIKTNGWDITTVETNYCGPFTCPIEFFSRILIYIII